NTMAQLTRNSRRIQPQAKVCIVSGGGTTKCQYATAEAANSAFQGRKYPGSQRRKARGFGGNTNSGAISSASAGFQLPRLSRVPNAKSSMGVPPTSYRGAPARSEPPGDFLPRNHSRGKYCYRSILYLGSPRIAAAVHSMHNEIFFPFFAKEAIFML